MIENGADNVLFFVLGMCVSAGLIRYGYGLGFKAYRKVRDDEELVEEKEISMTKSMEQDFTE